MQSVLESFCQRSHYPLLTFKGTYLHINDQFIHICLTKQPLHGYYEDQDCLFPTYVQQSLTVAMKNSNGPERFTHIQLSTPVFKNQQYFLFFRSMGKKQDFPSKKKNSFMDFLQYCVLHSQIYWHCHNHMLRFWVLAAQRWICRNRVTMICSSGTKDVPITY